ncbi:hypothetical protein VA7868_03181 [Vibrio aerogenes CECT 7868]|uniref:Uncharacterized protein n=1 Tax=Vibrio aerogenes CECT 7868 TaxID=1216006 RepID=A0A1M5ZT32_9VIBR|nr:hypothetical protein [Vibrio aerogenes]SHI27374.1 hypothetical protein VA7868_03181 [Vibrio aerogenes CECT 7868]
MKIIIVRIILMRIIHKRDVPVRQMTSRTYRQNQPDRHGLIAFAANQPAEIQIQP